MNQTKFAVAIVVENPNNEKEILVVKRPLDDESLPNVWGLPAVVVKEDELPENAARRVGKEKLATTVEPLTFMGIKRIDRGSYEIILMDIKSKLAGDPPDVSRATTTGTKYIDQQWTSDYSILKEAASKGSLCSQIFLEHKNIPY